LVFVAYKLGTRLSTGINTALLVQAELPATVLISALFFREYLTSRQLFGMAIAIMGMVVVLWQPDAHIFGSPGEWMILASTVVVVFGNRCGKAVLTVLEPVEVLMIRSFCTGIIMIVASSFLAPSPVLSSLSSHIWLIIGAQTVFILILSKIFWYSALRRLRLVQAASFLPSPLSPIGSPSTPLEASGNRSHCPHNRFAWGGMGFDLAKLSPP
jgi:drug/metabolite transporter (DMT)-like permease